MADVKISDLSAASAAALTDKHEVETSTPASLYVTGAQLVTLIAANMVLRGVAGSRPSAGTAGRLYYATDTSVFSRDNGSSWDAITLDWGQITGKPGMLSGLADGAATVSSGTVVFSNSNNVTFGLNGSTITGSASFAQTVESQSAGISNLGNTSGTTGIASGAQLRALFAGGNNITLSQSLNGASATITISAANQTVQTQNAVDMTLAGNTAGVMALVSSGTLSLAGGNNITLSQAGNAVTISAFNQTAQTQNVVAPAAAGTTYTSGTVVFSGGNNITVGTNGQTVTISAFNETPFGVSAGTQSISTGTLIFSNSNGLTFGMSGSSQITGSYSQSTHAHSDLSAGLSTLGNTSGNTGTIAGQLLFAGGNNITLSGSTNGSSMTITVSAFNQTVQTQNLIDATLAGNTAGALALVSSGTLTLAGGNNITLSQAGNAITISAFTQTVQTQNLHNLTLSGNTSGALAAVSSGTLTLAGGNNITLSQAGNAITISGANVGGAQTGISGLADGAGTVTVGTVIFSNSNNVSFGLNGSTFTASASQAASSQSAGMSNLGNTAGTTGIASGAQVRLLLAGGNNITLSQSLNGASATVTISAFSPTVDYWDNGGAGATLAAVSSVNGTMVVSPLTPQGGVFPGVMTASTIFLHGSFSTDTNQSNSRTYTINLAIYTKTGQTLSLLNSASTTWGHTNDANASSSFNGARFISYHSSQFSVQPVFSGTQYWMGVHILSTGQSMLYSLRGFSVMASDQFSGVLGGTSASATSRGNYPFIGNYNTTFTTAPPNTIEASQLRKDVPSGRFAPHIVLNNLTNPFS